jgi:peptidoglycan/xylan/chitin deacetylase (PgdA/CDA1 family)
MDHALYTFDPLPERAPIRWPNGAQLACCVFLYFEDWELVPPEGSVRDTRFRDPFGGFVPDYRTYTWRDYGNRVAIFRILDLLAGHGLSATVAANAGACRRYPFLVEQFLKRGDEFAAHGTHATRMLTSKLSEAEERAFIASSLDGVERATGTRPAGWIGQDFGESTRTPQLLAEAGLGYVVDWPNDDQPYRMTLDRPLLSIPNQAEWDDVQLLWHRRVLSPRYPAIVREAFGRLHQEGAASGRFFGLHIHPWLSGMPHRFAYLARALEHLMAFDGAWWTTAGEVTRHLMQSDRE